MRFGGQCRNFISGKYAGREMKFLHNENASNFVLAVKRSEKRHFKAAGILTPGNFRLSHGLLLLFANIIVSGIYNLDSAVFVQRLVGINIFQIFFLS